MNKVDKVLSVLSKEWKSTNSVSKEIKINWYVGYWLLNELKERGIIENMKIGKTIYWRLK